MAGISDVATEFEAFADWLTETRPYMLRTIATLQNGFEGWLKLELYSWLTNVRSTPLVPEQDVGLEYKLTLDRRHRVTTKQCDIWIRDVSEKGYHYVELKAPFDNGNRAKILTSAAHDFWYMSRIRASYEQAVSGNAIVLGVRFTDESWSIGIEDVLAEAGLPEGATPVRNGSLDTAGSIRWSILTKRYRESAG